jgi:4-aminobutyrate aminotransferase / (S)-3-amino-2-methylpropionate transaminase / 5-aminovalerate transaminase
MAEYSLIPVEVEKIETKYRSIKTAIPVPESLPIFEKLAKSEPRSMMGQPPIIWDKADNFTVADKWGNRWIDWSSCVLIANAGHGREEIKQALHDQIDQGLLATYVFVHEKRAVLTEMLQELSPEPENYQVFLLSSGSEATENCIKLAKTYAIEKHGINKKYFVSFKNAFHGRTMASQLAGGMDKLKTWIIDGDSTFIQVPFPDGYKNEDTSFELFLSSLKDQGINPQDIAGVMSESYQGVGPDFMPVEYAQQLEAFCKEYDIVLIMDEVQAGFGRSGKMFTFEHYGIKPDLIACGKGISSSLPISAVIGRKDIMGLYAPGSMTSTHSASPLCVTAAIENLKLIAKENLVDNAAKMGEIMCSELQRIQQKYPERLGCFHGKGLVAGIQVVEPGTKTPDPKTAVEINLECLYKGLLMFSPVGIGGECLKIAPPLTLNEEALRESLQVFEAAIDKILG